MLFHPREIAMILEVHYDFFLKDMKHEGSDIHTAFYRGLLEKEKQVREMQDPAQAFSPEIRSQALRAFAEYRGKLIIALH
jgi:hypothetical protein